MITKNKEISDRNPLEVRIKRFTILMYISCFLSLFSLVVKISGFELKGGAPDKPDPIELNSSQVWDVAIVRKLNLEQTQPDIRGLLQNMGVTKENQVIFGFLATKEKEDSWQERIFKNESIEIDKETGKKIEGVFIPPLPD